jgi:hypothetical protein
VVLRPKLVFVIALVVLSATGCRKPLSVEDYRLTVASAARAIPEAVEMETLFGDVSHGITHYGRGFPAGTQVWRTEAYLGDRYVVHMQVKVHVNYDDNTVRVVGDPEFGVVELKTIKFLPGGQGDATSGEGKLFSLAEWRTLYDSGGDLAVLGLHPNPTPSPGFDRFVGDLKAGQLDISLLGGKTQATVAEGENGK